MSHVSMNVLISPHESIPQIGTWSCRQMSAILHSSSSYIQNYFFYTWCGPHFIPQISSVLFPINCLVWLVLNMFDCRSRGPGFSRVGPESAFWIRKFWVTSPKFENWRCHRPKNKLWVVLHAGASESTLSRRCCTVHLISLYRVGAVLPSD